MAWMRDGSVAVTQGQATITGTGTGWSAATVRAGHMFQGPDRVAYEVQSLSSETSLTLATPYQGASGSGLSYAVIPSQGETVALNDAVTELIADIRARVDPLDVAEAARAQTLADALTELTDAYHGKIADIDNRITAKEGEVDAFIANADGNFDERIPLSPNILANALMDDVDETGDVPVPVGYTGVAVTLEAVHPYTKGFEGCYEATQPGNAVTDPDLATEAAPLFIGAYDIGPRMIKGGMRSGWGALGRGNILKMTAEADNASPQRQLLFPRKHAGKTDRLGFRCYIKLVIGSWVAFGNHAGWWSREGDLKLTKAEIDAGDQGWLEVDMLQPSIPHQTTLTHGTNNAFCVGFATGEAVEAYLALPYAYIPRSAPMAFVQ